MVILPYVPSLLSTSPSSCFVLLLLVVHRLTPLPPHHPPTYPTVRQRGWLLQPRARPDQAHRQALKTFPILFREEGGRTRGQGGREREGGGGGGSRARKHFCVVLGGGTLHFWLEWREEGNEEGGEDGEEQRRREGGREGGRRGLYVLKMKKKVYDMLLFI